MPVQFLDDYAAEGFLNVCIFILKVRIVAEIYTFVTCFVCYISGRSDFSLKELTGRSRRQQREVVRPMRKRSQIS